MISHTRLLCFLLSGSFGLIHHVIAQTACQDFGTGLITDYPIWSQAHIQPWCNDHDPASTGQCASLSWPATLPYPKQKKFHRDFLEWLMKERPQIGTRKDCIARSSALSVNTTSNSNGLREAVTCDLYSFSHHRRHECICFPVFSDNTTIITYLENDIQLVKTTTSVYYPPRQIIESCLLAAAQNSTLAFCTTKCPYQADVLTRTPRHLGDFPYCPLPGQNVQPKLVARTTSPGSFSDHYVFPSTTSPPPLPTEEPRCPMNDPKSKQSQCSINQCLWSFLQNITTTSSGQITFTDKDGGGMYYDWNTTVLLITGAHWGTLPSEHGGANIASQTSQSDRAIASLAKAYSSYRAGIGLPPKQAGDADLGDGIEDKRHRLVCTDEASCRIYCHDKNVGLSRAMFLVIGFGSLVSAIALAGMLYRVYRKRRRLLTRKNHRGNPEADIWHSPFGQPHHPLPPVQPSMEPVLVETERGPVLEYVEPTAQGRATGTLPRMADDGTSRRRGGKRVRVEDATFQGNHDGTNEYLRKASGRAEIESARGEEEIR